MSKGLILKAGMNIIFAEKQSEDGKKLKTFQMVGYTGGLMNVGWGQSVVVDLSGMNITEKARPILKDHDMSQVVGHSESISIDGANLNISGVISGAGEAAKEVAESGSNGFPWQASIGAEVLKTEEIRKGEKSSVNGKEIEGPALIARETKLIEISFVALGADDNTSATIAAMGRLFAAQPEESGMEFEQWCKERGFDVATLSEEQKLALMELYESKKEEPEVEVEQVAEAKTEEASVATVEDENVSAERFRVSQIYSLAAGKYKELVQEAVDGKMTVIEFSKKLVEALRAGRPQGFNINANGGQKMDQKDVIGCALSLRAGASEQSLIKAYGEKTLDASSAYRGISLQETITACAKAEGKSVGPVFGRDSIRAGFSTISLPTILGNTITRVLLDDFSRRNNESAIDKIFAIQDVNDFKKVARIRVTPGRLEEVAPGIEIPAVNATEEKYENQASTHAGRFILTYQDIVNDDLGFATNMPRQMSKKAFDAKEARGIALIEANAGSFFSSGHANLSTGVFNLSNLATAMSKLRRQKDITGDPINLSPKFVLVPSELEATANAIYTSTMVHGSTDAASDNYLRGKLIPIVSSFLTAAAPYYVVADPMDCAMGSICYLKGARAPQVEQGTMNLDNLSIAWTCWFDFGVALEDYRGAVKSSGA